MDQSLLEEIINRDPNKRRVSFEAAVAVCIAFNEVRKKEVIAVPYSPNGLSPDFLRLWSWLQTRHLKLALDFPEKHYGLLAAWYPGTFSFLSNAPINGIREIRKIRDKRQASKFECRADALIREFNEMSMVQKPDRAGAANVVASAGEPTTPTQYNGQQVQIARANDFPPLRAALGGLAMGGADEVPKNAVGNREATWRRHAAKVVLALFEAYCASPTPKLDGRHLSAFRAMSQNLQPGCIQQAQDALETTLNMLLEIVPEFACVREVIESRNCATGEVKTTIDEAQILFVSAEPRSPRLFLPAAEEQQVLQAQLEPRGRGLTLQNMLDSYVQAQALEQHDIVSHVTVGDCVIVAINQPFKRVPYFVCLEPVVVLGGRRFFVAGVLILHFHHFTTVLSVNGKWFVFNDQRETPELISNVELLLAKHATDIRLVVLRTVDDEKCHAITNFPNLGNSCYMNAILQLLFHCDPYMEAISRVATLKHKLELNERPKKFVPPTLQVISEARNVISRGMRCDMFFRKTHFISCSTR